MVDTGCPSDEQLMALVAGDAVAEALKSHVARCAKCRDGIDQLKTARLNLRDAMSTAPFPTEAWKRQSDVKLAVERPVPESIGRFRILRQLPSGGQADVYLTYDAQLDRQAVLKLAHAESADTEGQQTIVQEGKILAQLEHPNLARVYDAGVYEDRPYLAVEYVAGPNLRQWLVQRRCTFTQAATIVAKIADALEVAHRKNIIHQDIKPENVVIDEGGEPKLIDFGVALSRQAWIADDRRPGTAWGSPCYMAPEQARGETDRLGPGSDVFSLGTLLFELLTGRSPFEGNRLPDVLDRVGSADFDKSALNSAGVPATLCKICLRAMAREPKDRFASAGEMSGELRRFVSREKLSRRAVLATALLIPAGIIAWIAWPRTSARITMPLQELVRVYRDGPPLDLENAVPLSTSDRIRVVCDVPDGVEATVFMYSTQGDLRELGQGALSPGDPHPHLYFPHSEHEQVLPLDGPPGTCVVLVCAREGRPPTLEEVADNFDQKPWPEIPGKTVVVMNPDKTVPRGDVLRGPGTYDPVGDVEDRVDKIRVRLRDKFDFVAGVAFPVVEPR